MKTEGQSRLTAFDMFSGCGGLTEGLKLAEFRVLGAVELDTKAAAVYKMNHSEVRLWPRDVRRLTTDEVLTELKLAPGELDLLAGCPPCQGFSTLRTRNGSKSVADSRNNLLNEFLRFALEMRPRAVMLENVPGLETYELFQPFCTALAEAGYVGRHVVVDAKDFGVSQRRKRLIYMASLGRAVPFPLADPEKKTVRKAFAELPTAGRSGDLVHDMPERRSDRIRQLIAAIPKDGGSRTSLHESLQLECHKNTDGFKDVYGRMKWDAVAPTITSGCFNPSRGRFLHPEEDRAITIREASVLQGFPPDYKFDASYGKTTLALMVGNALPPPLIERHASEIRSVLKTSWTT